MFYFLLNFFSSAGDTENPPFNNIPEKKKKPFEGKLIVFWLYATIKLSYID